MTISNGFEWDTIDIIKTAWKQGKQIYVPKCFPENREMTFYKIENFNQTEVVYYNLLEPKPHETESIDKNLIDLIVVPGVVFDNLGDRKSTRLNSSHVSISYAVFCLIKKNK